MASQLLKVGRDEERISAGAVFDFLYSLFLLLLACYVKLSPGGLRQFTLSPVRDYDRTQELGLTLLGRVPMLALYPHTSLVYSYYYHNIQYLL